AEWTGAWFPSTVSYAVRRRFESDLRDFSGGRGPAAAHTRGSPGATPGPGTVTAEYANWYSGQVESLASVGSTPTSATELVPSSRVDAAGSHPARRWFESIRDHCHQPRARARGGTVCKC